MSQPIPKNSKNKQILIRISDADLELIRFEMAKMNQKNLSRFIRTCLQKKEFIIYHKNQSAEKKLTCVRDLLQELNKIGNNINQITRSIHRTFGEDKASVLLNKTLNMLAKINLIANSCVELINDTPQSYDSQDQQK